MDWKERDNIDNLLLKIFSIVVDLLTSQQSLAAWELEYSIEMAH
jgi:hypothetical protein